MLLNATSFELRKSELDFTSSGQGTFSATALFVGGVQIVNAIELLDFDDVEDSVQLLVCEECGIPGCQPGNWASIRHFRRQIVFLPAVGAARQGEWEANEYQPPEYMRTNGFPTFSAEDYAELRRETARFPAARSVNKCNSLETLDLLQFLAPGRILGDLGSPAKLQPHSILAVTKGELGQEIDVLNKLILSAQKGEDGLCSERPARVVEFLVDRPGFPTWRPFGYDARGPVLNLAAIED